MTELNEDELGAGGGFPNLTEDMVRALADAVCKGVLGALIREPIAQWKLEGATSAATLKVCRVVNDLLAPAPEPSA